MLEIDGAHGEGGGQLVRTAVALSAITGRPVRIAGIRAKRANPGLAPQHLAAVAAVAALCDAAVEGLAVKSAALTFRPGRLHGGDFRFDVGTAGSIALVLQALLPAAVASGAACRFHVIGGTDVRAAPPMDYLRLVLLPLLARMGVRAGLSILRRGYYPRGGGEVALELRPVRQVLPLLLDAPGELAEIRAAVHVANLPEHIAARMAGAAGRVLAGLPPLHVDQQILGREQATGAGGGLTLVARRRDTLLGAAVTAERGVPAEALGERAGRELRQELASGATLDLHAADQLLVYLALARGPSRFVARALSSHAATTIWLLERFLPARFSVAPAGTAMRISAHVPGAESYRARRDQI